MLRHCDKALYLLISTKKCAHTTNPKQSTYNMESAITDFDKFVYGPGQQVLPIAVGVCIGIATKESIYYILRDAIGLSNNSITGITPLVLSWLSKNIQNKIVKNLLAKLSAIIAEMFIWIVAVSLSYWFTMYVLKVNLDGAKWIVGITGKEDKKTQQQQQTDI